MKKIIIGCVLVFIVILGGLYLKCLTLRWVAIDEYYPIVAGDKYLYTGRISDDTSNTVPFYARYLFEGIEGKTKIVSLSAIEKYSRQGSEEGTLITLDANNGAHLLSFQDMQDNQEKTVFERPLIIFPLQMDAGEVYADEVPFSVKEGDQTLTTGRVSVEVRLLGGSFVRVPAGWYFCAKIKRSETAIIDNEKETQEEIIFLAKGIGMVKQIKVRAAFLDDGKVETTKITYRLEKKSRVDA